MPAEGQTPWGHAGLNSIPAPMQRATHTGNGNLQVRHIGLPLRTVAAGLDEGFVIAPQSTAPPRFKVAFEDA